MKTEAEIQAALNDVKAVCDKHGVVLMGTAYGEGVFGEILIAPSDSVQWAEPEKQQWNKMHSFGDGLYVDAIGTLAEKPG